ncbi:hypothetical protein ACFJGV_14175 [Cnuibacter sp. UC19_7]|uniref:hypothetical protein n=1 Tax=Cnuibacter sp. UC19_7 TaxID=3350166 RepID=UPI00366CE8B1
MTRRRALMLPAVAAALILTGCTSAPALSAEDRAALDTLAQVAGPTSGVDPSVVSSTECWLPSDHLIDDPSLDGTTWKVLCRVHYTDKTGDRYQDTTCIGDFATEPMLDHCYRWAHYDFAPEFGDAPAVKAG